MPERKVEGETAKIFSNRNALFKKRTAIIATVVIIALAALIFFIEPQETGWECPFLKYLGVYCPACGMTRAAHSLLHLRFKEAFRYNSFFTLTLPLLAYAYAAFFLNAVTSKRILPEVRKKAVYIYLLLFLAFGILRNFEAFSFLAPPAQ